MPLVQTDNKLIAKNTVFLYIRMLFVLIVSLYTSRVVLNTLGVMDFGVYNVVSGFVSLFAFLNATLSASVQRFYNYEGTIRESEGYRSVYVTSLVIHFGLSLILLLFLETLGVWYINNIMVIPPERQSVANVVFQTSVISLLTVILQIPYVGAIMARQCMSYYALVSVIDTLLKLGVVIILPYLSYDKLLIYAFLSLGVSTLDFLLYFIYSKSKFKELKFSFSLDKTLYKNILGFTGWNILGTFAFMIKGQGLNVLLNMFFGPIINAARGVAYQVSNAISGFSQNITIAFRPQIVNQYAAGEYARVRSLLHTESRVCFMLIATIITPVIIDIDYILHLWLGETIPDMTGMFTKLVLVDTLICTLNTPFTQVVQATGNIKKYQIASTVVNMLLLPISWIALKLGFEATSVFILTIIVSVLNQLVCTIMANKVFSFGLYVYFKEVLVPCCIYILVLPIIPGIISLKFSPDLLRLLMISFTVVLTSLPLGYKLALTEAQRISAKKIIIDKFHKYA